MKINLNQEKILKIQLWNPILISTSLFFVIFSIIGMYYLPLFDGWIAFIVIFGIVFILSVSLALFINVNLRKYFNDNRSKKILLTSLVCIILIIFSFSIITISGIGIYFLPMFNGWISILISFGVLFLINFLIWISSNIILEKNNPKEIAKENLDINEKSETHASDSKIVIDKE